jgi:hypothetical protein
MSINHPKVTIEYTNPYSFQLETINLIRMLSEHNDLEVLYLYAKKTTTPQEKDYVNMLIYFLIEKAEECMRQMKDHDTVGCNLENMQYGGNCWWSKSSYLRTLAYLPPIQPKDALEWLCMNHIGKHYEIHHSGLNHADFCYPSFLYKI